MGIGEMIMLSLYVVIPIAIIYWTVRYAVKSGIKDALDELKKEGKIHS